MVLPEMPVCEDLSLGALASRIWAQITSREYWFERRHHWSAWSPDTTEMAVSTEPASMMHLHVWNYQHHKPL